MHIFKDRQRFTYYRQASEGDDVIAGDGLLPIRRYGKVSVKVKNLAGEEKTMRLTNVAYCPEMPTNLVSLIRLIDTGIHWDTRSTKPGQTTLKTKYGRTVGV